MAGAFFKQKNRASYFRDEPAPQGVMWENLALTRAGALVRSKLVQFSPVPGSYTLAYLSVWLFTAALYIRPTELFPVFFEAYPIQFAKIFAITAPLIFFFSRIIGNEPLFLMTKELKMALIILSIAVLTWPLSINKDDTWKELNDLFIKVVLIFGLLIGTLDSRQRIYWMMRLTVLVGGGIAFDLLMKFDPGDRRVAIAKDRVTGIVGGMFSNPNDLATHFGMLLPLAVVLFFVTKTPFRFVYAACAVVFLLATLITFSRGGLLGMTAMAGVMMWKFRKRNRAIPYVAGATLALVFLLGAPGGLGDRLWTILRPNSDGTGSAQERRDNLKRGVVTFIRHPVAGIGMATFHVIGIKERRAHNSYLEIAAELGAFALLAYLILIFNPLKALWEIEKKTLGAKDRANFENYLLSVALQGTLVAYYVNSFFLSIQYLWFIYFPIAYAVGLRRIYEREQLIQAAVEAPPELAALHVGDELKGMLWRDRQRQVPGWALLAAAQTDEQPAPDETPHKLTH